MIILYTIPHEMYIKLVCQRDFVVSVLAFLCVYIRGFTEHFVNLYDTVLKQAYHVANHFKSSRPTEKSIAFFTYAFASLFNST